MAHKITTGPGDGIIRKFGPIRTQTGLPPDDFRATLRARWAALPPPPEKGNEIMGYTIQPVAKSAPVAVEVPDEMAGELEELYTFLTEHPDQVAFVTFDQPDERKTFEKQAKQWAGTREGGVLEYRRLRSNTLPATQLRFTIRVPLTDEEKAANVAASAAAKAKRDAAKAKQERKAS